MNDPSESLMGERVIIKLHNRKGMVRGYDPASKKWWVITPPMPAGRTTGWFSEEELIVQC